MKKKLFILFSIIFSTFCNSYCQVKFQKTRAGGFTNGGNPITSVGITNDGGYIFVYSVSGPSACDMFLVKTNAFGEETWNRKFEGISGNQDIPYSVQQTNDDGYIITGLATFYGYWDAFLIKTNSLGIISWSKTYGRSTPFYTQYISDWALCVQQTSDSGYIVSGVSDQQLLLFKTEKDGNLLWLKSYSSLITSYYNWGYSVQETFDGGYIVVNGGDPTGAGNQEINLLKTNSNGDSIWYRSYGGLDDDWAYSAKQTSDSGYIILGTTKSFGAGLKDVYLLKVDMNGILVWSKTYGGPNDDIGYFVSQTEDEGFIITGWTKSFGAGDEDVYLIRTNSNGDTLWTKTYGSLANDKSYIVNQTNDKGFIVGGFGNINTLAIGLPLTVGMYLLKTDSLGDIGCYQKNTTTIVTTPQSQSHSPGLNLSSTSGVEAYESYLTTLSNNILSEICCTNCGVNLEITAFSKSNLFPGDTFSVSFRAFSNTLQANNIFDLEIDPTGQNFINPLVLSSLHGTTSGTFNNVIIPANLSPGCYKFRIKTSSPSLVGPISSPIHIANSLQGIQDMALKFDGVNDYIDLGLWFNQFQFTVSFWVNPDSIQSNTATIVDLQDDLGLYANPNLNNNWILSHLLQFDLLPNRWNHVTITMNGSTRKVYLFGQLIDQNYWSYQPQLNYLTLGHGNGFYNGYFKGSIDELKVWNYELSQQEISEQVNKHLIGNEPGILAYYNFNTVDCDTLMLLDNGPNGHNGIMSNGAKRVPSTIPQINNYVSPNKASNEGRMILKVYGQYFPSLVQAKLSKNNSTDIFSDLVEVNNSRTTATCYFDLTGKDSSFYNVTIFDTSGFELTYPNAFTIIDAALDSTNASGPRLWIDNIGGELFRPGRLQKNLIVCGNSGNVDATNVPVSITVPANIEMIPDFEFYDPNSDTIQNYLDSIPDIFTIDSVYYDEDSTKVLMFFIPSLRAGETKVFPISLTSPNLNSYKLRTAICEPFNIENYSNTLNITQSISNGSSITNSNLNISSPLSGPFIRCGTVEYFNQLTQIDSSLLNKKQQMELFLESVMQNNKNNSSTITTPSFITIPVVFHILYNNCNQNICDAQIQAQIDQLNLDYSRNNQDASLTPLVWQTTAGASNIQFCLAKRDPNGKPSTGIERRRTSVEAFGDQNDPIKFYSQGGLDAWPASDYLNIWVGNIYVSSSNSSNNPNTLFGYAADFLCAPNLQGVVLNFGTVGSYANPGSLPLANLGRTATHEVGHWLGLRHIWGDSPGCSPDDGITDTPLQDIETDIAENPQYPYSDNCAGSSPGRMYMNFMDYSDDTFMNMFTQEQCSRMITFLLSFGPYSSLSNSFACSSAEISNCSVDNNKINCLKDMINDKNLTNNDLGVCLDMVGPCPITDCISYALSNVFKELTTSVCYSNNNIDAVNIAKILLKAFQGCASPESLKSQAIIDKLNYLLRKIIKDINGDNSQQAEISCFPPKDKKDKHKDGVGSYDPNLKTGPSTFQNLNTPFNYSVFFENVDTASAAAQEVTVIDSLDKSKFNLKTFKFLATGFGIKTLVMENPENNVFEQYVDLRPQVNLIVKSAGRIDTSNGVAIWKFSSLDPLTLELTEDPLLGFLPPDDHAGSGDGFVSYSIDPLTSVQTGDSINNRATIIFDFNDPINTNTSNNIIDLIKPQSSIINNDTIQIDTSFVLKWNGNDNLSGLKDYTVFVSDSGYNYYAWKKNTVDTSDIFYGAPGHIYDIYSIAADSAGNIEEAPGNPDFTISIRSDFPTTIDIKLFIEGFYRGNSLQVASVDAANFPGVSDTMIVELHSKNSPNEIVYSSKNVIDTAGNGNFYFPSIRIGEYYIVVKHRNALETWSSLPLYFNKENITYDFTNSINKAYGNNLRNLGDGNFAIWSGDISDPILGVGHHDGVIESQDYGDLENALYYTLLGYTYEDITGDGIVESDDYVLMGNNVYYTIILMRP